MVAYGRMPATLPRMRCLSLLLLLCILHALPASESVRQRVRLETLIAALTDDRASVYKPAMRGLVAYGRPALSDLAVLAKDRDPSVRARVAQVLSGIGGPRAFELLALLVADQSNYVRQNAALGLGTIGGEGCFELLRPLLSESDPGIRESAALALGQLGDARAAAPLAWWERGGPDAHRLQLPHGADGRRMLQRLQNTMRTALQAVAMRPRNIPVIAQLLARLDGPRQASLVTATWQIGDPRLSPVLSELLDDDDLSVQISAANALSANGDSRALQGLCRIAAGEGDFTLREAAARSLRRITGYEAGPGSAWRLWWRDHAEEVASLIERDAFIAALHDPDRQADRAELAAFEPAELMPLVDGVLGRGAPWWGPLAWRALRNDDAARWSEPLLARYDASFDERERVGLVVLLDELDDPAGIAGLRSRWRYLRDEVEMADKPYPVQGSLQLAFRLAFQRDD